MFWFLAAAARSRSWCIARSQSCAITVRSYYCCCHYQKTCNDQALCGRAAAPLVATRTAAAQLRVCPVRGIPVRVGSHRPEDPETRDSERPPTRTWKGGPTQRRPAETRKGPTDSERIGRSGEGKTAAAARARASPPPHRGTDHSIHGGSHGGSHAASHRDCVTALCARPAGDVRPLT